MTTIREDLLSIYHQMDDPTFNKKKLLQHGVYFNGKKYTELDLFTPRGQFILRLLDSLEKKKLAQKKPSQKVTYLLDSNNSKILNHTDNSMELNYQLFEKTNNLLYHAWNNIDSGKKFIQNNLFRSCSYFGKFVYNNPLISLGLITILSGIYYHKKILPIILTAIYQTKNLEFNEYIIEDFNNYLYLDSYNFGENNHIDNDMKPIDLSWLMIPVIIPKQPNSLEKKTPINSTPHKNLQNRKNSPLISITNINLEHSISGESAFLLQTNSLQLLIDLLKKIIKTNGYTPPNNIQPIDLQNNLALISNLAVDHNSYPSYSSQHNNQEFIVLIYIQQNVINIAIRLPSRQKFLLQLKKTNQFYTGTPSDSLMPNPNTNLILNDLSYPLNNRQPLEPDVYIVSPLRQLTLDSDNYYTHYNQLLQTALFDFNVIVASLREVVFSLEAFGNHISYTVLDITNNYEQSLREEINIIHCNELIEQYNKLCDAFIQARITINKLKNKISLLEEITINQAHNLIEEIYKIKKEYDPLLENYVFSLCEIRSEMLHELRMHLTKQIEGTNKNEQNDFKDNHKISEKENKHNNNQKQSEHDDHINESDIDHSQTADTTIFNNDVDSYNMFNENDYIYTSNSLHQLPDTHTDNFL